MGYEKYRRFILPHIILSNYLLRIVTPMLFLTLPSSRWTKRERLFAKKRSLCKRFSFKINKPAFQNAG